MSKLLYTRFTKLIIDYLLSLNKSIPYRSDSKLHSSQDDHPITKLLNTTNGDYKFGMEVFDAMTGDAIKKKEGYKYYMAKKMESENAKIIDEPEEQHVSPIKSGRKKVNLNSISIQEPRSQQRQRSQLTIDNQTDEAVADMYNKWGHKLKGPTVEDPAVQSLLDLQKGSKARRLENTNSDATLYSSSSDKPDRSANETDDADESDMDLSNDNLDGDDDDDASSSLDFIQTLLDETPANELTDVMSHPVYIDAQTTSVVHNPEGNHENAHHTLSLPTKKISYPTTTPQPSLLQAKAKKLMQKAKKNMRKFNFKKAVTQKFKEYDQKLEALINFNVSEAFEKVVQAKVLTEIKKLLPTHIPNAIANYVKPHLNTFMLEVMKTNL
ncbi:hypothetical protein Tco_1032991 [Tanacetum coccineum]|uniref:Uncharacterized protein n=1 Tax=Tanacetum coccineum TaxID=301880 RepID=A0ABQ5GDZ7_9ASTR